MIVNPTSQGWEIIFQRAHALLAAKLAYYLANKLRTPEAIWLEMLTSIAEHDDGQTGWKRKNHLTEANAPKDITQQKYNLEQARRVVSESAHKSRWIALMSSLHAYHLHHPFQGDNQEVDQFLEEQKTYQKMLRKSLKISEEESEVAYTVMRWCDECSLILCKSQIPPQDKKLEVGMLPYGTSRFIHQQGDKVSVSPWPFEKKQFEISVEYYSVDQLAFDNDQSLRKHLKDQSPNVRCWHFAEHS